jgi:hypothetical protein
LHSFLDVEVQHDYFRILQKADSNQLFYWFEWHIGITLMNVIYNALNVKTLEWSLLQDLMANSY